MLEEPMMLEIARLGINPAHIAITALWFASYGLALAWLLRRARAGLVERTWLWSLIIFFIPAGQFVAMFWLFSASRKDQSK
ncbi:MAG: hypothetical protein F4136_14025 [Chloroflexi bacterium]|nr:hypothetical protein [Chloroflexota bacterium]